PTHISTLSLHDALPISPVAAVENQQDAVGSCARRARRGRCEKLGQRHRFAVLVRQGEIRRLLPDARRCCRGRQLPYEVEKAVGKETDSGQANRGQEGPENLAAIEFRLPKGSYQPFTQ